MRQRRGGGAMVDQPRAPRPERWAMCPRGVCFRRRLRAGLLGHSNGCGRPGPHQELTSDRAAFQRMSAPWTCHHQVIPDSGVVPAGRVLVFSEMVARKSLSE